MYFLSRVLFILCCHFLLHYLDSDTVTFKRETYIPKRGQGLFQTKNSANHRGRKWTSVNYIDITLIYQFRWQILLKKMKINLSKENC